MQIGAEIVGRYRVVRRLSAGGMGEIWLCEDPLLHRPVAVKRLPYQQLGSADAQRRMLREARSLAAIRHPGIVPIHDVATLEDGGIVLVMELVEGASLRERLERGPLGLAEAARLLGEAARALGHMHAAGLVHRDLKPDNLMVRQTGELVLVDFGLAKRTRANAPTAGPSGATPLDTRDRTVTRDGGVVGTPGYLAPEQIRGDPASPAADQFQLAVAFYEALSGKLPWPLTTADSMMLRTYTQPPSPLSTARPGLPAALDDVFARALAWEPNDRFPDVRAFAEAAQRAMDGNDLARADTAKSRPPLRPGEGEGAPSRPPGTGAVPSQRVPAPPAAVRHAVLGASALLALGGVAAGLAAWRGTAADAMTADAPAAASVPTLGPDDAIACPPFDVAGAPPSEGWLGAAAAQLACLRAVGSVGGDRDRLRIPARLVGLPPQPTDDFPEDPYADPVLVKRAREAAREHPLTLTGDVRPLEPEGFEVTVRVTHHGRDLGAATEQAPVLWEAAHAAVDALQADGKLPERWLDPEIGPWVGARGIDELLQVQSVRMALGTGRDAEAACDALTSLDPTLVHGLSPECDDWFPRGRGRWDIGTRDEGANDDRETTRALTAVRRARSADEEERERIVASLTRLAERQEATEPRARVLQRAAAVSSLTDDQQRTELLALESLRLAPWDPLAWRTFVRSAGGRRDHAVERWAEASWAPSEPSSWCSLARGAPTRARIAGFRRCHALAPDMPVHSIWLVDALLEADEVREATAVAARLAARRDQAPLATAYARARLAAVDGRAEDAFRALFATILGADSLASSFYREGDGQTVRWLLSLASHHEHGTRAADELARRFVLGPDPKWEAFSFYGFPQVTSICLYASPPVRRPCLAAIAARLETEAIPRLAGADAYLEGALAFDRDDLRAASAAWAKLPPDSDLFPLPHAAAASDDTPRGPETWRPER